MFLLRSLNTKIYVDYLRKIYFGVLCLDELRNLGLGSLSLGKRANIFNKFCYKTAIWYWLQTNCLPEIPLKFLGILATPICRYFGMCIICYSLSRGLLPPLPFLRLFH